MYRYFYFEGDMMFNKLIDSFKNFDKLTCKIMKYGLLFCSVLCSLSIIILMIYTCLSFSPFIYYIGINLFQLSTIYAIEFVICALVVDGIKKQLI